MCPTCLPNRALADSGTQQQHHTPIGTTTTFVLGAGHPRPWATSRSPPATEVATFPPFSHCRPSTKHPSIPAWCGACGDPRHGGHVLAAHVVAGPCLLEQRLHGAGAGALQAQLLAHRDGGQGARPRQGAWRGGEGGGGGSGCGGLSVMNSPGVAWRWWPAQPAASPRASEGAGVEWVGVAWVTGCPCLYVVCQGRQGWMRSRGGQRTACTCRGAAAAGRSNTGAAAPPNPVGSGRLSGTSQRAPWCLPHATAGACGCAGEGREEADVGRVWR